MLPFGLLECNTIRVSVLPSLARGMQRLIASPTLAHRAPHTAPAGVDCGAAGVAITRQTPWSSGAVARVDEGRTMEMAR